MPVTTFSPMASARTLVKNNLMTFKLTSASIKAFLTSAKAVSILSLVKRSSPLKF